MYKAAAIDDKAAPGYSDAKNYIETGDTAKLGYNDAGGSPGTGTGTIGDADESEGAEDIIDITMPEKTNKIFILFSY